MLDTRYDVVSQFLGFLDEINHRGTVIAPATPQDTVAAAILVLTKTVVEAAGELHKDLDAIADAIADVSV